MAKKDLGDVFADIPGHPLAIPHEQAVARPKVYGVPRVLLNKPTFARQDREQLITLFGAGQRALCAAPDAIADCVSWPACINAPIGLGGAFGDDVITFRRVEGPEFQRADIVAGFVL